MASSLNLPVPIIALCLGEKGKLSRVLNSRYTSLSFAYRSFGMEPGEEPVEHKPTLHPVYKAWSG
jgi:3-dehydroquinate dehydratase